MSDLRIFLVYYQTETSEKLCEEPIKIELFEHIWRFCDIFLAELEMLIETRYKPKIKYNSEDGKIQKIRGVEDFENFVKRLEKAEKNEEIIIILENSKRVEAKYENAEEVQIFPSSLQKGEFVGEGTHGTVRMAFHEETQKWYVIKTILSQNNSHEIIEKEILAYKECSKSEFVVGYFGCEVSSNRKELVLEYMDRADLRTFGVLPFEVHQQVALALIRGLTHIWKSGPGYIHRDIKPENILVNSEGYLKICDFGAAKRIDNTNRIASSAAGTVFYQAPEQKLGWDYSQKVDVWSFGLTLWELAIGPNLEDFIMGRDENGEIRVPKIDGFPDDLTVLIKNCLRKKPNQRWNGEEIENCGYLKNIQIDRNVVKRFLNKF